MFLGVDGGGTKTAYAVIDANGCIRTQHVGNSVTHLAFGFHRARELLIEGIRDVLSRANLKPSDLTSTFIGLPGYGEDSATTSVMDEMPAALFAKERYRCGNDVLCSWSGSLGCVDGISVIAGTGSIAYGEYQGRSARCGGWGELVGDEGSAYWIAREGLTLFTRMSDGRAQRGPLYELVRQKFAISLDLDLCAHLNGIDAAARSSFAQLATLVYQAALANDPQAVAIFERGALELMDCVVATRRSLSVPDDVVLPVSHTGSVLNGATFMLDAFKHALSNAEPAFEYRAPLHSPDIGAALYAARLHGTPIYVAV